MVSEIFASFMYFFIALTGHVEFPVLAMNTQLPILVAFAFLNKKLLHTVLRRIDCLRSVRRGSRSTAQQYGESVLFLKSKRRLLKTLSVILPYF